MGLNSTPGANRLHIGFFGLRNVGKSSLVNAITNQEISVVSDTLGTTTDPVQKSMELLPLGPVVIIDTPGYDDVGELGEKRVKRTKQVLAKTDVAVLVTEVGRDLVQLEEELISLFKEKNIPYLIALNKADLADKSMISDTRIWVSALTGYGIEELKEKIGSSVDNGKRDQVLVSDLVSQGDTVVLVVPIDASAPKGRLILPQQQVIRDLIDHGVMAVVTKDDTYTDALCSLKQKPALVICDSQVFGKVSKETPADIRLTSFSILMARMKGFLKRAVHGAEVISRLKSGDKVLIAEGCTHHRQCEDIGTVKLPNWIREYTGCDPQFEFSSGGGFPEDLSQYKLIIHCGGCMITEKEVIHRMNCAEADNVAFTNYGTAIAYMKGILKRSTEMFDLK